MIRDASTIGFPACWIVVPGVNTIFTANNLIARIKAYSSKRDLLARLAANKHDEQTERLLMNYILFDEYNFYSGNKLFDDKIQVDRLGAFLALKLGDYEKSKHFFEKLIKLENDETERDYLSVMLKYVNFRVDGLTKQDAHKILRKLFKDDKAERVINDTEDLDKNLNININSQDEAEIFAKINNAMRKSGFGLKNQDKLLDKLSILYYQ